MNNIISVLLLLALIGTIVSLGIVSNKNKNLSKDHDKMVKDNDKMVKDYDKMVKNQDKRSNDLKKLLISGQNVTEKTADCLVLAAKKQNLVDLLTGTICADSKGNNPICEGIVSDEEWKSSMIKCGISTDGTPTTP